MEHLNSTDLSDPKNTVTKDRIGYRSDLQDIPDAIFDKAAEWQPHFERYVMIHRPTKQDAVDLSTAIGMGIARTYEYINQYRESPDIIALMPSKPTGGKGASRLDPTVEAIIQTAIADVYNIERKGRPYKVYQEVRLQCYKLGLKSPSATTVSSRIAGRNIRESDALREGNDYASSNHDLWKGHFPDQMWPLSVVQYDHTPMDLQVIDEETGRVIGRPYVTLGYDVKTKCIVGLYVSLLPPSSLSVGLCVLNTSMPKREWLQSLGVDTHWPMFGKPDNIHVDNANEFRGFAVHRACTVHRIGCIFRGKGKTNHGGGVERSFRTLMQEIHNLDGTTFSNVAKKGNYDAEKNAVHTLKEAERIVISFITKQYHVRKHTGNPGNLPPRVMWQDGIYGNRKEDTLGRGLPKPIADPKRFLVDFLPQERRVINQEGIVWDYIWYMDDVLSVLREKGKKFIVKRDPRDISVIFLLDPETAEYYEIPYKNLGRPAVTAWEHSESLRRAKEFLDSKIDEDLIFEGIEEIRGMQKAAKERKAGRKREEKRAARTKNAQASAKATPTSSRHSSAPAIHKYDEPKDIEIDFDDTYDEIEPW